MKYDYQSNWILNKEKQPEEDGKYLVCGKKGSVNIVRYDDGRWYGGLGVVAWMPLPPCYKEKN